MRFPITTRIILAVALILSVGLLSMAEIFGGLASVRAALHEVSQVREPGTTAAYQMEIHLSATAMHVLRYLETSDPEARRKVGQDREQFLQAHERYVRTADGAADRNLAEKLRRQYGDFHALGTQVMERKDRWKSLLPSLMPGAAALDRPVTERMLPSTRDNTPEAYDKGVLAMAIQGELDRIRAWLPQYVATREADLEKRVRAGLEEVEQSLARYRQLSLSGDERQGAQQLEERIAALRRALTQVSTLEEQIAGDTSRLLERREAIERVLTAEIQRDTVRKLDTARDEADQAVAEVLQMSRFLVPVFILCCVVSAVLLIHLIRSPVRQLVRGTIAVAGGDLAFRIPSPGRDEFGDLARNFNHMVEQLQATTVSKERLEASEERLTEANRALQVEVRERQEAQDARERTLAREQEARATAEAAERRLAFLAEASAHLASTLDFESALERVTRAAVPFLADCCAVEMLDGERRTRRIASCCAAPEHETLAREAEARLNCARNALRTGEAEVARPPASFLGGQVVGYMALPLVAWGHTLGTITFLSARADRPYGTEELWLAEDLARRVALAIENGRLYRAVQEADQRKNEFLAMLGHELRNPLGALSNAVYLLRRQGASRSLPAATAQVLERQVRTMARLVDDLLDVSRITRGKVELRKEPVNVAQALEHAVQTARPLVELREHRLTVNVPPEPVWVDADPTRLEQIVTNLLNNAAKYTEPGGRIELSLDIVRGEEGGESAVIRVRDTGIGIAPEMLPHVFDLFAQADRSLDRSEGGLGIGLTLVHGLTAMHGGTVSAHSEGPGRGSEFTVRLPLQRDEGRGMRDESLGPSHPSSLIPHPSPQRVLVVDDNVDAAQTLSEILELWGHSVRMAHDGAAGVELALAFRPDLVLLDIGLPVMDGYEVARSLRHMPGLEETRLAALTGYAADADRRRSREAGFDFHLTKPVDLVALREVLDAGPERPSHTGGDDSANPPVSELTSHIPANEHEGAHHNLGKSR